MYLVASVRLWTLSLLKCLVDDLDFLHEGHPSPWLARVVGQVRRSKVKVKQ